jgi:MFS family permease
MQKELKWYQHFGINAYFLGQSLVAAILGSQLTPFLILFFAPYNQKETYLGVVTVVGLAIAMLVQPMAGMISDRSRSKLGRRRPFIMIGAILNSFFVFLMAISPFFGSFMQQQPALLFGVLLGFIVLLVTTIGSQFVANIGQAAIQGVIPDVVPEKQRGFSSGVKAVFELLPSIFAILIGPLVDRGYVILIGIIMVAGLLITMTITVLTTHEEPQKGKPEKADIEPFLRITALTAIFVATYLVGNWGVTAASQVVSGLALSWQITIVSILGLVAMAGAIIVGVYFGAKVGIGKESNQHTSFIWWIVNRLMFLAGVRSIQAFSMYFLMDVLKIQNAATINGILMASVGVFLMIFALLGGYWSDRVGKKKLVALSGYLAAGGTLLLVLSGVVAMLQLFQLPNLLYLVFVIVSGCVIGSAAGIFMATNWAVGTDLAPAKEAGKFLGISNLAGAGAGIVGTGIGASLAQFFNNSIATGVGYLITFSVYALMFILSSILLVQVKHKEPAAP